MEYESDEMKSRVEILWKPVEKSTIESEVNPAKRRIRVAAYCRVSTAEDIQMNSLEMQKRHYLALVHNTPDWELMGVYIDNGITGTDRTKRLGFQRMIRHCEEGKIDKILCKSISRFGRNTAEVLDAVKSLKERNIGVVFEKENIDTLSENSEFVLSALAAIAQDESRSISENISWSYKRRFQQGKPIFKRILGYSVKKIGKEKVISIIEEEADIIREIFKLALEGIRLANIAERMIERGFRTVTGKNEWSGRTIKAILTNERYTGDVLCQKGYTLDYLSHDRKPNTGERPQYIIENYHPAIITRETFNQVQELVRSNKRVVIKKRERHPFSGRLHCGECGAVYQVWGTKKDRAWKCGRSRKSSRLCSSGLIYESQLLVIMKKAFELRYGLANPSIIHRIYLDIANINVNDNFEKQRLALDNKLATAMQIEKNTTGSHHYRAKVKRQKLEEKIFQIEEYWKLVEEDRMFRDQTLKWLDKLPRTENNAMMIFQLMRKEMMRALVMDITLFPEGTYVIKWADDTETKIDDDNLKLLIEQKKSAEPTTIVRKYKSIEDTVTKTDLISQALKVKPQKTMNYKPLTWSIPEIQDDDKSDQFNRKKVCAYCRVSTNSNDQLCSFELQVSHYTQYILSNDSWKFSGIYADEGASGTSVQKRSNFLRMIEDCKAGKIDLIITKSISRFARNTVDCLTYVRLLKALPSPVGVYFERENINTLSDNSDFLLTIFSGLAQDESRSLSESVRWGIKRRYEHGISPVPSHFLGYKVDKLGNWTINEEEAETVRRIYREYLEGKALRQLARDLTKEGVKTGKGKTIWGTNSLYGILINEKYCGDILLQKRIRLSFMNAKSVVNKGQEDQYFIENHHTAIIPKNEWSAVQQKIHRNRKEKIDGVKKKYYPKKHHPKEQIVFAEKIFCGECGTHFMPKRVVSKEPQKCECYIWKCKATSYFVPGVECHMESFQEAEIENAFMAMLLDMKKNSNALIKEVRKAAKSKALTPYEKQRVEILKDRIKTLHKEMNQVGVLNHKDASSESLGKILLRFSQANERLQTKLDKFTQKADEELLIRNNLSWFLSELKDLKIGDPFKRCIKFRDDIFSRIVNRCVVLNNGRIIFELNMDVSRETEFKKIEKWKRKR